MVLEAWDFYWLGSEPPAPYLFAFPHLQIEEVQAVQFVEDVMGQGRQTTAVHMEALEFLESAEGSPLQPAEAWIVTQIQLLQIPQLTEGPCLNPCDVVGEKPQNLMEKMDFKGVLPCYLTLHHCMQCIYF